LAEVANIAINMWHSRFYTQIVIWLKTRTKSDGWQRSLIHISEARSNISYSSKINNNPKKDGGRTSFYNKGLTIDKSLNRKG